MVQLYVRADQPTPWCPVHPILHNAPCLTLPMHPLCHGRVWLYIWPHGLSNTILLSVPWQPAFGQILRAVGKFWLGSTQGPCAGVQIPASTVPCPPTPSTPTSRRTTSRQYRMMCCMHSCPTPRMRCCFRASFQPALGSRALYPDGSGAEGTSQAVADMSRMSTSKWGACLCRAPQMRGALEPCWCAACLSFPTATILTSRHIDAQSLWSCGGWALCDK